MYVCYKVGKKKKKQERMRKKNLVVYATDVALLFVVPTPHLSCLHIYRTKISRPTQHLPIGMIYWFDE
jgi:hypothetical protein